MNLGKRIIRRDYFGGITYNAYMEFRDTLYDDYSWFKWRIDYMIGDELNERLFKMQLARMADDISYRLKGDLLKMNIK